MVPTLWNDNNQYRRTVLKTMQWLTMLAGICFICINIVKNQWPLAIIEMVAVAFTLAFARARDRTRHLARWTLVYLCLVFLCILLGIWQTRFATGQFIWMPLIPMLAYLLMGKRTGTLLTAAFVLPGLALFLALEWQSNNTLAHGTAISNIALSVLLAWMLSYVYESNREAVVSELQRTAERDPLTGLHNRLHLESVFQQLKVNEKVPYIAMLLVDIDLFKHINDQFGHTAGDEVLRATAKQLRACTRRNDWLFRVGGEEFCVLLPAMASGQAAELAEQLRLRLSASPVAIKGRDIDATISVGLSNWPLDGEQFHDIYQVADTRLYRAKKQGRNQVVAL
ncbi:GGDEF domain-containing protein [Gallaecimonas mangrovi]|uniref:GGDEF domain-containing protein n=1 Tax=Gallaecimonas mangrovi TaxID=2291597 RepID=UPI000E1FE8A4|nr:GGDEF domain-containing protein [Gallaecimonas mangrovi]